MQPLSQLPGFYTYLHVAQSNHLQFISRKESSLPVFTGWVEFCLKASGVAESTFCLRNNPPQADILGPEMWCCREDVSPPVMRVCGKATQLESNGQLLVIRKIKDRRSGEPHPEKAASQIQEGGPVYSRAPLSAQTNKDLLEHRHAHLFP